MNFLLTTRMWKTQGSTIEKKGPEPTQKKKRSGLNKTMNGKGVQAKLEKKDPIQPIRGEP